jgi:MerR family transcriptional regulator, copper efflux regulator
MATTFQIAEVAQRSGFTATLSAQPVDGPCDDTCGCTTDTTSSSTGTRVPLIAKADATTTGDDAADDVPIACTLGAGEMSNRLDEWNTLLQGVTARHRIDGGLRLELRTDTDVTEIARLAAAEQSCCRFFDFALVIDGRGIALDVHAPPDGQPVLTGLFGTAD